MSNMVINTNVMALNSHRSLKTVGNKQEKASARLSTGYRINSAADDAAGLAISEKMRSQIRGLDMASKNSQDAISLVQTAEGGMQEIDNMVQRIRELVVQASNDTNDQTVGTATESQGDRQKIQDEINQLLTEIDSMSGRVEFNNKKLIDGSLRKGADADHAAIATAKATILGAIDTVQTAAASGTIDAALTAAMLGSGTAGEKAILSDYMDRIKSAKTEADMTSVLDDIDVDTRLDAGTASDASITSWKTAVTTAKTTYDNVLNTEHGKIATAQANIDASADMLYFQVGANASQSMTLSIGAITVEGLGIGNINVVGATGSDITGQLSVLDEALSIVTTERSKLGAAQNRLEYTIKSLDISSENLSASESRIRDTDMAKEMMQLTAANVLQQASTSMLAQANQSKQSILQLLQ